MAKDEAGLIMGWIFIGEAKDTVVLVVVVIMVIIVLGAMGVAFGMEEFANQLINSIT